MSRFARHDGMVSFLFFGKGGDPSLRSGRHFVSVRRGLLTPFDLTEEIPRAEALGMTPLGHPKERKRRGVSINGGGLCPPPTPPKKNFCRFGVSWEGCPLLIMCHPELILRGVSSFNRGGELTLLELHPKKTLCL